jgi:hypothetical protein
MAAVMAVVPVPRRDTRAATTVEQFLADEIALADAYELAVALELKRRKSLAVTPYEYRLIGALAENAERNLNRTLRAVASKAHG